MKHPACEENEAPRVSTGMVGATCVAGCCDFHYPGAFIGCGGVGVTRIVGLSVESPDTVNSSRANQSKQGHATTRV